MSRYEKYETLAQQVFVAEQKRYRRRIAAGRFLLLFLLLALRPEEDKIQRHNKNAVHQQHNNHLKTAACGSSS